jgi:ParB family transcriptional regulator, chromosome partitioning protein
MPADLPHSQLRRTTLLAPSQLKASSFSFSIYGDPNIESDDLLLSVREFGILVPLVVAPEPAQGSWEVISGHRRLACALALGLPKVPCVIRSLPSGLARWKVVLEYNRQRRKTFSQLMREADALEDIWGTAACSRKLANLKKGRNRQRNARGLPDRRDSDDRAGTRHWQPIAEAGPTTQVKFGRTDSTIARQLGMGGKDTYRQARAIWKLAQSGDSRAQSGVAQLDVGSKTIHAAYKDLRRRDRFGANFRPTPYDVWLFRHDQAFGIPYPGAIPPGIVAHALYYYTKPGNLVVDPMAGGGTTLDVCRSMNRRCLAYDIAPSRPDIFLNDIRQGFPLESAGCDLIFCDPPYHTMLAGRYCQKGIASSPLDGWLAFLLELAHSALATLRPGGYLALLLASQTEKDLRLLGPRLLWLSRNNPCGLLADTTDQLPVERSLPAPTSLQGSQRRPAPRPSARPPNDAQGHSSYGPRWPSPRQRRWHRKQAANEGSRGCLRDGNRKRYHLLGLVGSRRWSISWPCCRSTLWNWAGNSSTEEGTELIHSAGSPHASS